MFSRKSLGVSVSSAGVAFALLGGSANSPRLEGVSSRTLSPGILNPSLREPNILNPRDFVKELKEGRAAMQCRGRYVSLSLPDAVGRVMMLDMEERFGNRSEALDILRWKLKKRLPFDAADAHLDYQVVATRDNGDISVLVALAFRPVISQYEEIFAEADLVPIRIDLNLFSLAKVFEQRLESREDYAFLSSYDSTLGIIFVSSGKPELVRSRDMGAVESGRERIHHEIRCSFLSFRAHHPGREIREVFCVAPPDSLESFAEIAGDALGCQTVLLETKSALAVQEGVTSDPETLFPYTTAIGAAIRGL